jgi:hypothetical protein
LAKQTKYSLSVEDVYSHYDEMLETTAMLAWNTSYSAYTFAFHLNQLYGLELQRRDDICLSTLKEEIQCSVYSYDDMVNHLSFYLIENGLSSRQQVQELSYFDKTLLIHGPESFDRAQQIYDDLNAPERTETDLIAMQREALRLSFVNSGIVESESFDFSDPDEPRSSMIAPNTTPNKKQQAFLDFQMKYIQGIFVELDDILVDFD